VNADVRLRRLEAEYEGRVELLFKSFLLRPKPRSEPESAAHAASSRTRKAMGLNYFSQRAKQDPQRITLFRQQVNENLARAGKI